MSLVAQKENLPSQPHDTYTRLKKVGEGNFGCAYLVQSQNNKECFIMKKIRCKNDRQYESIFNEVKTMKKMRHPYVITYKESYQEKGSICILMEYAKGGDLATRLAQQRMLGMPLEEEQILEWFIQLCYGLKYIHEHKILHRDFKSENIFLTDKGLCKIGDFGICKVMKETYDLAETKIGTPYCMAPQIWEGKLYNQKSDIWSLGCVLYELCTLKHPFVADNSAALCLKIVSGKFEPIPSMYSKELRGLVNELLNAKETHKRPSIGTILEKDFIRRRKKQILSKSMNISYQESLELSQRLIQNKNPQPCSFRPRSLSLPSLPPAKSLSKRKFFKPKLKLEEYKQSFPIIEEENKAMKEELRELRKEKEEQEMKVLARVREMERLLEGEFVSVEELREVIRDKLGDFF